jgi:hypothetical protein
VSYEEKRMWSIRRWRSVPRGLRPSGDDFRPMPHWRWSGDLLPSTIAKMNAISGFRVGHLSNEEVREVSEYVRRYVLSTVAVQYAAALAVDENDFEIVLKEFGEAMRPLVDDARDCAARPERSRLAAVLDHCRRLGMDPF